MADNTEETENTPVNWQDVINETEGVSKYRIGNQEVTRNLSFLQEERNRQLMEQEDYEERIPRAYVARFDRR